MPDPKQPRDRAGRRRKRFLTPAEKYQVFSQVLSGEMNVAQCAEHWGVDRSTIMKAREAAKQGALAALAVSRRVSAPTVSPLSWWRPRPGVGRHRPPSPAGGHSTWMLSEERGLPLATSGDLLMPRTR